MNNQGYSVPETTKALGINPNMFYRWKEKFEDKQTGNQLSESELDELIRLRKENRNLRMRREKL